MRPRYTVTKRFGHELGLSACFRQWRASSHCHYLHGYALAFEITYEGETLDERGWLIDFGGLKAVKDELVRVFDHKLLVAADDPNLATIAELGIARIADVLVMDNGVGAEAFARWVADIATQDLIQRVLHSRVRVAAVSCAEHAANVGIYYP